MQIETFWQHWQITENPFRAEEARDDPVLRRLMEAQNTHPDFPKIYGQGDQPSSAVVFGEKGSGKTALRLQISGQLEQENLKSPGEHPINTIDKKGKCHPAQGQRPILIYQRQHRQETPNDAAGGQ